MVPATRKEQQILIIFIEKGALSSSSLHAEMAKRGEKIALVTVKRMLSDMAQRRLLITSGAGRSTVHSISSLGRLGAEVEAKTYAAIEPDRRYGQQRFNAELLPAWPQDPFTAEEMSRLLRATEEYLKRTANLPEAIRKKELERLTIELAWKSSRIEGNTYSLLDTEKLILENKEAPGHDRREAVMILNHKDAFYFLLQERDHYKAFTRHNLEELHRRLTQGLSVNPGLRRSPVGITGSLYRPLDNVFQIQEAVEALADAVSRMNTPYAKALVALMGISYIQPFEDGNKRTARMMANALLLAHACAPLSYRSVEESDYRDAMLTFYELNSIIPFRTLFVAQYEFAAQHYAVK